ncbi:MAG: thioredoxin domain-containing protein [Thermodesulfobacteriota bacterium]
MLKKSLIGGICLLLFVFIFSQWGFSQEDKIGEVAINTFRTQIRLPPGIEIKFLEKNESPIRDFYSVKLLLVYPDKEVPVIIYVDKAGEKVIIGNLFIKGENINAKEAGPPKPRKIDMGLLEMEKSPSLGNKGARVTIVEFSNFQCPYCMDSWTRFMGLMKRYPQDFKYIFKHFPFQPQGKTFELSKMAAAAQEVSNEAFWIVHDFFFTKEGQNIANLEKGAVKQKVEQLLKGKGYDVKLFQSALETGRARNRVLEDMALANRLRMTSTPTKIVNGDMIVGLTPDSTLERYLGK